ncbi:hypothetical protein MMC14_009588 [Varicellaria rhodocarpa]|nr:hypothetical protein [Varicellaria rhodocarpa]
MMVDGSENWVRVITQDLSTKSIDMYTAKGEKHLDTYRLRSSLPAHELANAIQSFMQAVRVLNAYPHVRCRDLDIRRGPEEFSSRKKAELCSLAVTSYSSCAYGRAIQTIVSNCFSSHSARPHIVSARRNSSFRVLLRFLAASVGPGDFPSVEQADDVVRWEIGHYLLWFVRQTVLDSHDRITAKDYEKSRMWRYTSQAARWSED